VEDVVVAAGAEAFGVEGHLSFASFACGKFWLPFELFVTGVTEAFGVMFFLFCTIDALFYHVRFEDVRILKSLCKRANSVRFVMEERHTICIVRTFVERAHNTRRLYKLFKIVQSAGANFCGY